MKVSVDGRPLDLEDVRDQGIGRYAQGLLRNLPEVARERDGELVVLRERGPQLFAGADVHHCLSLYEVPLLARPELVVTMHDVAPLLWPSDYLRSGLKHRLLYSRVRRAAAIVCPSNAARDDVVRHLEVPSERVHVIPEAVDDRFRPAAPAAVRARLGLDGPYLLYVGSQDDPRKGVESLVEAFAEWSLAEQRPETLVLAGKAADLSPPAGANVVFTGFVPDDELPALYSGAMCTVSASRYEGFGLPALESLACGTPVVAYDAGAMPETAGPGAVLVPLGDAAGLMSAAGRLGDDQELRDRLAEAGQAHARAYSWRRTAEETWDLYEQVAA